MSNLNDIKEYVTYTSTISLPDELSENVKGETTWSGEDNPLNNYFMTNFITFLSGRKTYFVAIVTILYALGFIGWQNGDWNQAAELTLGALGLGALRNGMK